MVEDLRKSQSKKIKTNKSVWRSLLRYLWVPIVLVLGAVGYEKISDTKLDNDAYSETIKTLTKQSLHWEQENKRKDAQIKNLQKEVFDQKIELKQLPDLKTSIVAMQTTNAELREKNKDLVRIPSLEKAINLLKAKNQGFQEQLAEQKRIKSKFKISPEVKLSKHIDDLSYQNTFLSNEVTALKKRLDSMQGEQYEACEVFLADQDTRLRLGHDLEIEDYKKQLREIGTALLKSNNDNEFAIGRWQEYEGRLEACESRLFNQ